MIKDSNYVIIKTAVPKKAADKVRQAMGQAGAGQQGNYINCSGSSSSIGRFTPKKGAKPAIGKIDEPEEVEEETIEMLCHKGKLKAVVMAIKKAHPYEEPPIDIIPRLEIGE